MILPLVMSSAGLVSATIPGTPIVSAETPSIRTVRESPAPIVTGAGVDPKLSHQLPPEMLSFATPLTAPSESFRTTWTALPENPSPATQEPCRSAWISAASAGDVPARSRAETRARARLRAERFMVFSFCWMSDANSMQ